MDNDLATRFLVSEALGQAGFCVEQAEDGRQALAVCERGKFDLITLDVPQPPCFRP
ncbi:MAG: hypothetical protein IPM89_06030 [Candidatus Competibacteraceae bacterium]|nr:MAG: hypothetical protein IPM89_06030 [Candidatus Competibacteraceae bacterium]